MHVWGYFSKQGFGTLHIFTDNLNAAKMVKIYQKALLPSTQRWFIRKNENWLLQEDNDPKHQSRLCTACLETREWRWGTGLAGAVARFKSHKKWALMKFKLQAKQIWNVKQLFQQIRLIWRSPDYAIKLVESMPQRWQLLIGEATGQFINNRIEASRFMSCSMCVFFSMPYPK